MKNKITSIILISIIAFNSCKKADDDKSGSTPTPVPVANFTFIGANVNAPATVMFVNTSQNATSFSWDFGDGITSGSESPSHIYAVSGTYSVKLTAAGAGGINSISKTVSMIDTSTDTTAPVVTLNGSSTMTLSLNTPFTDPGATAIDDRDGSVTVSVSGVVDVNLKGTYTLTYSATDMALNVGTAIRTVHVVNDAEKYAGTYYMTEDTYNWVQTITTDNYVNNRIHFSKFAAYDNNSYLYANVTGINVNFPSQTGVGIGTNSCNHYFVQNGVGAPITQVAGKYTFSIKFTDQEMNSGAGCPGTSPYPYEDFFVQQ